MRDKTEKVISTELGDDPLVGHMIQHEEKETEKSVVRKVYTQLKTAPKSSEFVETGSEDSEDETQEPVKKIKPTHPAKEKTVKSSELLKMSSQGSRDSDVENTLMPMSFYINRALGVSKEGDSVFKTETHKDHKKSHAAKFDNSYPKKVLISSVRPNKQKRQLNIS